MAERYATSWRRGNSTQPSEELGPPRWLGPLGRFPLLVGVVCGLAICLIGGLALTALHGRAQPSLPAPDATAQQICNDLVRQDYASLYALLSSAQQADGTEAQFEASQRQLDIASGNVTQCSVSVSTTDEQAAAQFTLARDGAAATNGAATLIYANGGWRLDAYDSAVI